MMPTTKKEIDKHAENIKTIEAFGALLGHHILIMHWADMQLLAIAKEHNIWIPEMLN